MYTYLGQVHAVREEFERLMPVTAIIEKQHEQQQTIFLVLTLAGLPNSFDSVHDQILASPQFLPLMNYSLNYFVLPHLLVTEWSCHQPLTPLFSHLS